MKLAEEARRLQETLLWPSDQAVISYLRSGHIKNCNLTPVDLERANRILGPPKSILTSKMIAPSQKNNDQTQLPMGSHSQPNIKLYVDVFFVNGLAFLYTKTKPLNYITIQSLHLGKKTHHIIPRLKYVMEKYTSRGYLITDVFTDNKFDRDEYCQVFLPANLHLCATGKHVPIIERSIQTIKERVGSTLQGLPYTTLPRLMYTSLLERVERTLNNFPHPWNRILFCR